MKKKAVINKKPYLTIDIVTIFPGMFAGPLSESLLRRGQEADLLKIRVHDLRRWSDDPRHKKVDDRPYGGGAGMLIQAEPLYRAIKELRGSKGKKSWVIFLSPQGQVLSQKRVEALAQKKHLILVCGHYEGVDERILRWVDQEISIGDYVLTGGEIPALVVADAVARFVPGVVGDPESVKNDSFTSGILDYPHYTRPQTWRGKKVPDVLLSGNHRDIKLWRQQEALRRTRQKRPDLLVK
jgi:tRNA (guanine37-N1)-methyltransferase